MCIAMETIVPFRTVGKTQKTRRNRSSLSIAAAVLLTFICPPVVQSAEPDIGTLTALRGMAVIKRPGAGSPLQAAKGMPVRVADIVEAGPGSAAQVSLSDESFMNLAPGASVRVNQYSFDALRDRRTAIVRVLNGKVRFVIFRPRKAGSFRVEAGNALVTAGGLGDLVIEVSPGRAEIAVLEHGLSVMNSLSYVVGNVNLGANQRTLVKDKEPPAVPKVITTEERKELLKDVKKI